jgi:transcriptional regulator with XRE-family HTH domain
MDGRTLLGRRVKHLRRLRKLTQEQLAEHIEINPKHLSSIEEERHRRSYAGRWNV